MVLLISEKSALNGSSRLRLLFDTNVIIDFLKQKNTGTDLAVFDLGSLFLQHECFVSVITKLELLKYPAITPDEENVINEFLKIVPVIPNAGTMRCVCGT